MLDASYFKGRYYLYFGVTRRLFCSLLPGDRRRLTAGPCVLVRRRWISVCLGCMRMAAGPALENGRTLPGAAAASLAFATAVRRPCASMFYEVAIAGASLHVAGMFWTIGALWQGKSPRAAHPCSLHLPGCSGRTLLNCPVVGSPLACAGGGGTKCPSRGALALRRGRHRACRCRSCARFCSLQFTTVSAGCPNSGSATA